jgi:outer membrane lipoprotein LolB
MLQSLKWIGMAGLVLLSGGCMFAPQPTCPQPSWKMQQAMLSSLNDWTFSGIIRLDDGRERHQYNLYWQQQGKKFHLVLSGPLGLGAISINGDQHRACLNQSDNKPICAEDVQHLMKRLLGWSMPVNYLQYWIKGQVWRQEKLVHKYGLLRTLYTRHNKVNYERYQCTGSILMPEKILVTTPHGSLQLEVDTWKFNRRK